ncbi:MAG: flavin reductase family protein [Planctomycetota bacterium]|nr:flavin reductase family protein [Planctomycetota bacterium]
MNQKTIEEVDRTFKSINQAIWIVTTAEGESKAGLTATWVHQASIDRAHPTVLLGLAPNHRTCELLLRSGAAILHLLHPHQSKVALHFARPSSRHFDKFSGLATRPVPGPAILPTGVTAETSGESSPLPVLENCHTALIAQTITSFDAGDRIYLLCRITELLQTSSTPFLRESDFFATCQPEEIAQLRNDLAADVTVQRPMLSRWIAALKNRPGSSSPDE